MEELDLKELFEMFWNKKIHIIILVIIFMAIGVGYTMTMVTPMYKSSTTFVLTKNDGANVMDKTSSDSITASDLTLNSKLVATYTDVVKSKTLIRTVISNLNLKLDEGTVRKNVSVGAVSDAEIIEITVKNEDPAIAAKLANEIVNVFTDTVKEIYNISNVYVVDKAEVDEAPFNINHTKDIIIFGFIGGVIAVAYVLIANMLDTTIKTKEDIEKNFKLSVLVTIPKYDFSEESLNKKKKGGKR